MKKNILMLVVVLAPIIGYTQEPVKAIELPAATVTAIEALPDTAPSATTIDPSLLPPPWLEKTMTTVSSMPVVGPYVVEVLKWLGVISSVLTALVTALLGVLMALQKVLQIAKLADLALKVEAFMSGPIMYWLKFLSVYNAKKKVTVEPAK